MSTVVIGLKNFEVTFTRKPHVFNKNSKENYNKTVVYKKNCFNGVDPKHNSFPSSFLFRKQKNSMAGKVLHKMAVHLSPEPVLPAFTKLLRDLRFCLF